LACVNPDTLCVSFLLFGSVAIPYRLEDRSHVARDQMMAVVKLGDQLNAKKKATLSAWS
jgi:hypothetical protein